MFHTACWHILVLCVLKLLWRHGGVNGGLEGRVDLGPFLSSIKGKQRRWLNVDAAVSAFSRNLHLFSREVHTALQST